MAVVVGEEQCGGKVGRSRRRQGREQGGEVGREESRGEA